jgi:hypothetical protein
VKDYKVVLVSPTTHMYWNLASPRGLLTPSCVLNFWSY